MQFSQKVCRQLRDLGCLYAKTVLLPTSRVITVHVQYVEEVYNVVI